MHKKVAESTACFDDIEPVVKWTHGGVLGVPKRGDNSHCQAGRSMECGSGPISLQSAVNIHRQFIGTYYAASETNDGVRSAAKSGNEYLDG